MRHSGCSFQKREKMRLEEQLRHSHKLEAIGQLARGIAHEFNNILTAIIGNIELARTREISPADREEVMDSAQKAAHRAVMVTRQLLAFGRKSEPIREAHNLGAVAGIDDFAPSQPRRPPGADSHP